MEASERFAGALSAAETRLRASGLGGRRAFVALCRHLAARLGLPAHLWPEGPDAPAAARLDEVPLAGDIDLFGLAYERFFVDLFKGERGQYFTPRPLIELMADLARLRGGMQVLDPTCGSGGFLLAAIARGADADGIDCDPDLATLARLNLALVGANPRSVRTADFFAMEPDHRYDVILANPPFSIRLDDPAVLAGSVLAAGRPWIGSDTLFVERVAAWLRPGGRLVTVLPYGVLTNPRARPLRDYIDATYVREAVISLPEGVFRPFGGTSTRACVLALVRRPALVTPMLAAVVRDPGFDVRRRQYRRTERDDLVALRLHIARNAPQVPLFDPPPFPAAITTTGNFWAPEDALAGVVPPGATFRVGDLARIRPRAPVPIERATLIDFADVDKTTGEITGSRSGTATGPALTPGDVLFGRMRPELNNVTRAERPSDDLPAPLAGSGEWIALEAAEPDFLLLALRSRFARDRLPATAGQTRPRVHAEDVLALELPDPGESLRRKLAALYGNARAERRVLRQRLEALDALYHAFGVGDIDARELGWRLDALAGQED